MASEGVKDVSTAATDPSALMPCSCDTRLSASSTEQVSDDEQSMARFRMERMSLFSGSLGMAERPSATVDRAVLTKADGPVEKASLVVATSAHRRKVMERIMMMIMKLVIAVVVVDCFVPFWNDVQSIQGGTKRCWPQCVLMACVCVCVCAY